MRILQISSAQSLGGGERHLVDLVSGLVDRGHDVYLALRPNSPVIDELKLVPRENITTLPLRNAFDVKSAESLAALVRRNEIQLIHAHLARDYPLAAYAARRNPSAKLIITRHVLFPLNRLHRITLTKAARIIAVSQAVASQLRSSGVVTPERISVVLNGINTARFASARSEFNRSQFLESWELPSESLLVGTVGELTPLKGQEEFLYAARQVLKQCPPARFIIAGIDHSKGHKNRARLEDLIGELGLDESVSLIGWVEDLSQLYSALDVFVSASHTESFGLALAEGMASGSAVVATESEGARELIEDGKTGLLVPIGDVDRLAGVISVLLNDGDSRTRMGKAAQLAAAARFSVERMIAETEEIYRVETQEEQ